MKVSPLGRITATLLLTALLALALGFAVQGAFQTRARIASTFARQSEIQRAQIALEELLRLQIDEENSLRGYSLTRDPFYSVQYQSAASEFTTKERTIRGILEGQHLTAVERLLTVYAGIQSDWRSEVATPLLRRPGERLEELDMRSKVFSDYEARMAAAMRAQLAMTNDALARSTQEQLDRTSYVRAFWLLVFGLLAILFNAYRSRLNRELEEERTTTEILQRAFRSESSPLPHCEVGSAYVSATRHLAVGGDVFDAYRISNNLALLSIADVSGKGIDAAVLTAFIKFMIRAIALRLNDPGAILAEFNTAFTRAVGDPYMFVSMFVGILDTDTFELRYASAGHDSIFLRRDRSVRQLPVTGPVLGVMEEPFATERLVLERGDILVLTTDGLTEARDRRGRQLLEDGAMRLIEQAPPHAQAMADDLVTNIRRRSGNRLRDDLAILAVTVKGTTDAQR